MAKIKKAKKATAVPKWEIERQEREKKHAVCTAVAKAIEDSPYLLERLDNNTLEALVRATINLEALYQIQEDADARAGEQMKRKLADERYKAQSKARQDSYLAKEKARRAKAKPRKATPVAKPTPIPKEPKRGTTAAADSAIAGALEDKALDLANANGSANAGELLKAFPLASRGQVTGALARLVARGRLMCSGKGRYTKYTLPNGAGAAKAKAQLELGEPAAT